MSRFCRLEFSILLASIEITGENLMQHERDMASGSRFELQAISF